MNGDAYSGKSHMLPSNQRDPNWPVYLEEDRSLRASFTIPGELLAGVKSMAVNFITFSGLRKGNQESQIAALVDLQERES